MARRNRTDLRAPRNMIDGAHLVTELPEDRPKPAYELLGTALKLAAHLLSESPAVTLGKLGRQEIAERGARLPPQTRREGQDTCWRTPAQATRIAPF
jgi:hypothetical protein